MSDEKKTSKPLIGMCLCEGVRVHIQGTPQFSLLCCCQECQTIGGGFGVGSAVFPSETVKIEDPKDLVKVHVFGKVHRSFCSACGTHLIASDPAQPATGVHAGILKNGMKGDFDFTPQVAIWCQNRSEFWKLPDGVPSFPQYPPPPPSS